jgi:hypothetical protein
MDVHMPISSGGLQGFGLVHSLIGERVGQAVAYHNHSILGPHFLWSLWVQRVDHDGELVERKTLKSSSSEVRESVRVALVSHFHWCPFLLSLSMGLPRGILSVNLVVTIILRAFLDTLVNSRTHDISIN